MAQRLRYTELAPAGMDTLRGVEHYCNTATYLAPVLLELVRLRASQLNGCTYCAAMHSHELERHNEPAGRIVEIAHWRESKAYTQRERAALAWTEAVTNIQDGHASDRSYKDVREHFSERETVDLTIAITSINAWNRMAIAFRAERRSHPPTTSDAAPKQNEAPRTGATAAPIADDGGKVEVED